MKVCEKKLEKRLNEIEYNCVTDQFEFISEKLTM